MFFVFLRNYIFGISEFDTMQALRDALDRVHPYFAKGGMLHQLYFTNGAIICSRIICMKENEDTWYVFVFFMMILLISLKV